MDNPIGFGLCGERHAKIPTRSLSDFRGGKIFVFIPVNVPTGFNKEKSIEDDREQLQSDD